MRDTDCYSAWSSVLVLHSDSGHIVRRDLEAACASSHFERDDGRCEKSSV